MNRIFTLLPAVLLLLAARSPIEAPLPPVPAWSGASEALVAERGSDWETPAEKADFRTAPDLAATYEWIERLDAASPLIAVERFGTSPEGRPMIAVIARKGDAQKPVLLVQAGIHAGEIDGKDAGLMLLRDIAFGGKDALLDRVTLVFAPVFNVDGHERASRFSRPNQRGPEVQGWRNTAQNLNLNRDYLKADAPEMRALIGLIRRWDPALYLDLHVTDGIDYQYDITYGFNGWDGEPAQSPAIARWMDSVLRPAFDTALSGAGHIPGPLIFARDNRNPDAGLSMRPFGGRFSHGYGDLRRMPTVLVENHSLKPYRQRVLGTYVLIEAALRLLADDGEGAAAAIAADRAARPEGVVHRLVDDPSPRMMPWRGIAYRHRPSPISGRDEIEWLGSPVDGRIATYRVRAGEPTPLPVAWWVPASKPALIALLDLHGISVERIESPRTLTLDHARLLSPAIALTPSEGRVPLSVGDIRIERRRTVMPAGSVRVPADQPLALLAAALLDPESAESLLAWGGFAEILSRTEYIEGYAIAPLAERMLAADPALQAAFHARLAEDPAFAVDPGARLAWFYERSHYFDDRYRLYPVGREIAE